MIRSSLLLRRALLLDAVASGAMGVLLGLGGNALAPLFNLPDTMLRATALFLIVYATFVGALAARERLPALLVWTVIIGNAAWTLMSLALLPAGPWSPTLLGQVFIAAQAIAVGVFAELQYVGLRRSAADGVAA